MASASQTNAQQMERQAQEEAAAAPKAVRAGEWICACGQANTGKFCSECGSKKPSVKFCTECGAKLDPSAKFCSECGHRNA